MPPKARNQLTRIMRRDGRKCGIHVGGCGKHIPAKRDASIDHMISQSFMRTMADDVRRDFEKDWNVQPMYKSCNNGRGGQMDGLPLFQCKCHFLQIGDDDTMYVHEMTDGHKTKHVFLENVVQEEEYPIKFTIYPARIKSGGAYGYNTISGLNGLSTGGHMYEMVPRIYVLGFNWFELARVGMASDGLLYKKENKEAYFYPNGRIWSNGKYFCAAWYSVEIGHYMIGVDPFTPYSVDLGHHVIALQKHD